MVKKLPSLTIFFPFYNDAGTVEKAIREAYQFGKEITDDLEVIALHGGASTDDTYKQIMKQKKRYPRLIVIDKRNNRHGYAVIKWGFLRTSKEWVFYTDGDLQYSLKDLKRLAVKQRESGADVVNGYKVYRRDSQSRVIAGNLYKIISSFIFRLPITDATCDFRLIRRRFLQKIVLKSQGASVTLELIKRLQRSGAVFAEVPVKHYARSYGKSNYSVWKLLKERIWGECMVWFRLQWYNQ